MPSDTAHPSSPPQPTELPQLPPSIIISHGAHETYQAGTCALELVDFLDRTRRGETICLTDKLTDKPACVCPVIGEFVRAWNDGLGEGDTGDAARSRLLGPLLPLLLDTRDSNAIEQRRAWMATDWLARVHMPAWLDLAGLTELATEVRALLEIRDSASARAAQPTLDRARIASAAAWDAAWDAARAAARAAASAAARAAARDAARAAAWDAARAAARAAASAAARAAARDAARAAASAAARAAARAAASAAAWDAAWDAARAAASAAARDAAWDAASAAARDALQPTVETLQLSAVELVRSMCALRDEAGK